MWLLIIQVFAAFYVTRATPVILAQSGLSSIVTAPGAPRYAAYVNYNYSSNLSAVSSARWIWDGTGDTSNCNMNITVQEAFTAKCLNLPLTVYIAADNTYTSQILGFLGAGNSWSAPNTYNIPTTGVACGENITLTIKAANSGTTCSSGNPAALIYAVTTPDCLCAVGTAYNSQTCLCDTCRDYLSGCLKCPSFALCLQCDANTHFQLSTGTCVCSLGYGYVTVGDTCQPVCGDGYVRNPELCDDGNLMNGDGCDDTCSVEASYTCTRPLNAPSVCTLCRNFLSGCLECPSLCTLCDANFQLSAGTCSCSLGYSYVLVNDRCDPICGDGLVLNTEPCDDGNNFNGDGCDSTCVVEPTHTCTKPSNAPSVCTLCRNDLSGCLECSSTTVCSTCDANFQLSAGTCSCSLGYSYVLVNDRCDPICGDGLVLNTEPCDDGNNFNGDGCDSTCVVEPTYTCTRPLNAPSVCTLNHLLKGQLQSVLKDPFKNTVTFTIQLSDPNFPGLSSLNSSQLLISNLLLLNPVFTLSSNGLLTLTYDFTFSIEGANLTLIISLSTTTSPSIIALNQLTSPNNAPLTFYNQSTYDQQHLFMQVYKWAEIVSYAVLLFGITCDKVVGVQLFGVWQTIFFSLGTIDKVQPLLYPILDLKTVNGINTFMQFQNTVLPERVRALNVTSQFIGNCSYTVWLAPIVLLLGLIVYLAGRLAIGCRQKLQMVGRRIMCEYFTMIVAFNTLNICYSAGLQFKYQGLMPGLNLTLAVVSMGFVLGAAMLISLAPNDADFGEFKLHFKHKTALKRNFFIIKLFYRAILGFGLSILNQDEEATIVLFFMGIVFFIYIIGDKPYRTAYHMWRTSVIQLCCLTGLGSAMFYRSMRSNSPISTRTLSLEPGYVVMAAIMLSISVSILIVGYEFYLKYIHNKCAQPPTLCSQKATIISKRVAESTIFSRTTANLTPQMTGYHTEEFERNGHSESLHAIPKFEQYIPQVSIDYS